MININKNTNYSTFFDEFEKLYSSFYISKIENLPTYNFQTKLNTPLIITSYIENLISDSFINDFRENLFYLGYLHSIIPNALKINFQKEFKRTHGEYLIPRSYFQQNEITYSDSEFGHVASNQFTPKKSIKNFTKNQKFSYEKLYEICFSSSSFRFMIIKAECMIFLYYYFLTNNIEYPQFYGAFNYALTKASQFENNSITYGIIYVWELVTAFNHFISSKFHEDFNLPLHHVYSYPKRFNLISQFGNYDISTCNHKLNLPEIDFIKNCSLTPRCLTNIPSNEKSLFILPYEIDPNGIYSASFNNFIDWLINDYKKEDINQIFYKISLINEYENYFEISEECPQYIDNGEFFVKTIEEADKYKNIKKIDGYNLYLSIMIKNDYSKELKNIKI